MSGPQPRGGRPGAGGQLGGSGGNDFVPWIKLGFGTYLTFGLGTAITIFLFITFASDSSGVPASGSSPFGSVGGAGGSELFGAFALGLLMIVFLAGGLATALGLFIGRAADQTESAPLLSAVGNAAGAAGALLVLVICIAVFAPDGADAGSAVGDLIAPTIGLSLGVAITGAGAAWVSEQFAVL